MTVEYDPLESQLADLMAKREAEDIRYGILHHSATAQGNAESFRKAHLARGFLDIGYHFVICNGYGGEDGEIQPGRPELQAGAHCVPRNADSLGICLVGDFTRTLPTPRQLQALDLLLRRLCARYPIIPARVIGHNAAAPTACPGDLDVSAVRERLTRPLAATTYEDHREQALAKLAAKAKFNQPHQAKDPLDYGELAVIFERLGLI